MKGSSREFESSLYRRPCGLVGRKVVDSGLITLDQG